MLFRDGQQPADIQRAADALAPALPRLSAHFRQLGFDPLAFVAPWVHSRFAVVVPTALLGLVWERHLLSADPDAFVVSFLMALLSRFKPLLLELTTAAELSQILTCKSHLTQESISHPNFIFDVIWTAEENLSLYS